MSERDEDGYDIAQRRKSRQTIAQAIAEHADSHEVTAGGICTGYVLVMEMTTASGRNCLWLTGSGGPPDEEHTEGLDAWRLEGLVRHVLRDLNRGNVSDE